MLEPTTRSCNSGGGGGGLCHEASIAVITAQYFQTQPKNSFISLQVHCWLLDVLVCQLVENLGIFLVTTGHCQILV